MTKGFRRTGVFANDKLAYEAVARELVGLAIVEGHQPIGGEDTFTSEIVGSPTTKWTGRTILVVHDNGRFVAYTSNTDLIWEPSVFNLEYFADEEDYFKRVLHDSSAEALKDRLKYYGEISRLTRSPEVYKELIAETRLELKRRERRSRIAA